MISNPGKKRGSKEAQEKEEANNREENIERVYMQHFACNSMSQNMEPNKKTWQKSNITYQFAKVFRYFIEYLLSKVNMEPNGRCMRPSWPLHMHAMMSVHGLQKSTSPWIVIRLQLLYRPHWHKQKFKLQPLGDATKLTTWLAATFCFRLAAIVFEQVHGDQVQQHQCAVKKVHRAFCSSCCPHLQQHLLASIHRFGRWQSYEELNTKTPTSPSIENPFENSRILISFRECHLLFKTPMQCSLSHDTWQHKIRITQ